VPLKGTRMPCCIMGSGVLSMSAQWNYSIMVYRYTLNIKRRNRAKSVCTISLVSVYLGVINCDASLFAKVFHKVMHRNDTMLVQYTVLDQINISLQIVVLGL
jgi:hypothetical protein